MFPAWLARDFPPGAPAGQDSATKRTVSSSINWHCRGGIGSYVMKSNRTACPIDWMKAEDVSHDLFEQSVHLHTRARVQRGASRSTRVSLHARGGLRATEGRGVTLCLRLNAR